MTDTETRLRQLSDSWQTLSPDGQQRAIAELDELRSGLDPAADQGLVDRLEALRADLTLTVGLQPPSEELGFKG
ncbi:hypothetical protein [Nakamurella deserti]|uniref:hypothetical protein n=1 Tax=Nakamurella deserti TaxID=2164074 RepID=UPI000DBE5E2C|nr:hypothetical protein [Nakamurella deserti]